MRKTDTSGARRARLSRVMAAILAGVLTSCAGDFSPHLPPPLQVSKSAKPEQATLMSGEENKRKQLTATEGVETPLGRTLADPLSSTTPPKLAGENIGIDFEGIKLPSFVNTVFGELLKVSFEIDSAVTKREQLVTLRTADPLPPDQFYRLVVSVLGNYGLTVVYQNNVYRIIEASTAKQEVPQIVRARTLANVPGDQRTIFYFAPLHNTPTAIMQGWLELALKDRVRFSGVGNSNGILLMGRREDIAAALETIEILDQPYMAGNRSLKISPAFWSALRLTEQLVNVLNAEGYSTGIGQVGVAIKFVPIEALNTIIVFSTSQATLQHVLQWAKDLDQPSQTINTQGIYYYQVQNASAKKVADLIGQILGQDVGSAGGNGPTAANEAAQGQRPMVAGQNASMQQSSVQPSRSSATRQRVLVDESRNAIVFQGTAEEYAQFRTLVEQMDRAPLEVMIEATVAEVTLDKSESLGIVLGFDDGATNAPNRNTILSDTGIFATLLRSRGQISASIKALAANSRITVLSTPRLVTTSGVAASIQVGSQVPIITTQQTAPSGQVGGTSNILQDVQYRSTGILLNVKPTINSSRRVEMAISQEVSSASANNISKVDSPIIQQRSLQTNLSLSDGETALLGGLISENYNTGNSGIPYLKDIPIIGNLFKNSSNTLTRTELIVLLTPYIIDGPETANAVRDAFKARLGEWAQDKVGEAINDKEARKPTVTINPIP